jgi:hypothetical protein
LKNKFQKPKKLKESPSNPPLSPLPTGRQAFSKGEANISSLWDHFPVVRQAKGGREGFSKR